MSPEILHDAFKKKDFPYGFFFLFSRLETFMIITREPYKYVLVLLLLSKYIGHEIQLVIPEKPYIYLNHLLYTCTKQALFLHVMDKKL